MSDTLPHNFEKTLAALTDPHFFDEAEGKTVFDSEYRAALDSCLTRWRQESGKLYMSSQIDKHAPILIMFHSAFVLPNTITKTGHRNFIRKLDKYVLGKFNPFLSHNWAVAGPIARNSENRSCHF